MSLYFNRFKDQYIDNLIKDNIISLLDDHTELDLHFSYRDIEVTSKLNNPYPYNKINVITDIPHNDSSINIDNDCFRTIYINIDVKSIVNQDDEELDEDIDDIEDDDDTETFNDRLKRHFSSLYLSKRHEEGYSSADSKLSLLGDVLMSEVNNIFVFSSTSGLKIFDDHVEFMAPYLSMSTNRWIAYACSVIDKLLDYNKEEDEEDDFDLEDEE